MPIGGAIGKMGPGGTGKRFMIIGWRQLTAFGSTLRLQRSKLQDSLQADGC